MTVALSVLTPVYNGESFIGRCYATLERQTFADWEWVVVDDGSVDDTRAVVERIDDPRIVLVSYDRNQGRGYARTKALEAANGDWIVVWDADDLYFPDRLAEIERARLEGFDFFCSYVVVMNNLMSIKGVRGFSMPVAQGLTQAFVHHTLGCRTRLAREIGYDSLHRVGEDTTMIVTLAAKYRGLFYEDALTVYQEEREVGLEKAIASNKNQLQQFRWAQGREVIGLSRGRYLYLVLKWCAKLVALYSMRLSPGLYTRTIGLRSYGKLAVEWELSQKRYKEYRQLVKIARKFADN